MDTKKFSWKDDVLYDNKGREFGRCYYRINSGYYGIAKGWVGKITDPRYIIRETASDKKEEAMKYLETAIQSPPFFNKKGFPTSYGYSCGYIFWRENVRGDRISMWKEAGTYHVRVNPKKGKYIWTSWRTVKEAYKSFYSLKKEYFNCKEGYCDKCKEVKVDIEDTMYCDNCHEENTVKSRILQRENPY